MEPLREHVEDLEKENGELKRMIDELKKRQPAT